MDRAKLAQKVSAYFATFGGRTPDANALAAYVTVLHELNDDQIELGLAEATARGGSWPLSAGDLHSLSIAEYATAAASERQRRDYESDHGGGPRVYCLTCEDRGLVFVWNPAFLDAFRGRFYASRLSDPNPCWLGEAQSWWRRQEHPSGALRFVVRCDCNGERTRMFAEEQDRFAAGDRKRPPACGMAVYAEGVTPLATVAAERDLADYYEG